MVGEIAAVLYGAFGTAVALVVLRWALSQPWPGAVNRVGVGWVYLVLLALWPLVVVSAFGWMTLWVLGGLVATVVEWIG